MYIAGMVFIVAGFAVSPIVLKMSVIIVHDFIAVVARAIMVRIAWIAYNRVIIAVIFAYPVSTIFTPVSVRTGAILTPPFIQIFNTDKIVRITIFIAFFTI